MRATLFKIIIIIIMTTIFWWWQHYLKDNSSSSLWKAAVLAVTPFIFKNDTIDLTTVLITITIVHNIVHIVHHIHCHCSHHSYHNFHFLSKTFFVPQLMLQLFLQLCNSAKTEKNYRSEANGVCSSKLMVDFGVVDIMTGSVKKRTRIKTVFRPLFGKKSNIHIFAISS